MKGHSGPIVGLGCQMLQVALISISEDSTLRAWRIKNGKELEVFKLDERPEKFAYEPRTNMAACALSDGTIELIDCSNAPLKRVRRFRGHSGGITNLAWKADARWLISSSIDCSIRTWDMATGALIDQFSTVNIPTSGNTFLIVLVILEKYI